MSIRPVDFNGMIQRTQDVTTQKQNEDNRPHVEQQTIHVEQQKQEMRLAQKVAKTNQKENEEFKYDAKNKGNGSYEENKENKGKKKKKENEGDGKVLVKGPRTGFDIKI